MPAIDVQRVKYGDERGVNRREDSRCPCCGADKGSFHNPECQEEECHRCDWPQISCDCDPYNDGEYQPELSRTGEPVLMICTMDVDGKQFCDGCDSDDPHLHRQLRDWERDGWFIRRTNIPAECS